MKTIIQKFDRWVLIWHSANLVDGCTERIISNNHGPLLFRTRKEARELAKLRYGYIHTRPDLRAEPHGWRLPVAVKATITIQAKTEVR